MIEYLIYILTFVIGSILGLLWSYKKHGEPYVIKGLDIAITVIALIGWILIFNFTCSVILIAIGFFLVGFVLNERPGYGRLETVIGIVVSAVIYLIWHLILMV